MEAPALPKQNISCSGEPKVELFGHNSERYKTETTRSKKTTNPQRSMGPTFLQQGLGL